MSETLHDQIVEAILASLSPSTTFSDTLAMLAEKFPTATEEQIDSALSDAADQLEERAAQHEAELDAFRQVSPLFEGMPEGMELGECARIKAQQGDPLALAFLEWEKRQAGGVQ